MSDNYFLELAKVDCSDHVENKGNFSYLSWPFAVKELCSRHPKAAWEAKRFPLPENPEIMVPYMQTPLGYFVEVAVTIDGVTRSQIHPVLDNRNNPIPKPSPFDINTSIQRALVKAIGLHGLGLYIYAGEDLPDLGVDKKELDTFTKAVSTLNEKASWWLYKLRATDQDKYRALHGAYMATVKSGKVKKREQIDEALKAAEDRVNAILTEYQERIDEGEDVSAELAEQDQFLQQIIHARLTPEQQQKLAA